MSSNSAQSRLLAYQLRTYVEAMDHLTVSLRTFHGIWYQIKSVTPMNAEISNEAQALINYSQNLARFISVELAPNIMDRTGKTM